MIQDKLILDRVYWVKLYPDQERTMQKLVLTANRDLGWYDEQGFCDLHKEHTEWLLIPTPEEIREQARKLRMLKAAEGLLVAHNFFADYYKEHPEDYPEDAKGEER